MRTFMKYMYIQPQSFHPRAIRCVYRCFMSFVIHFFFLQILQTGQEINELDQSGFNTLGPTIYAGNLGSNKYIIQVSVHQLEVCLKDFCLSKHNTESSCHLFFNCDIQCYYCKH